MKSIKSKILFSMIATVAGGMIVLGVISIILNYFASVNMVKTSIEGTAQVTAARIQYEMNAYKNVAMAAGAVSDLSDEKVSVSEKQDILNSWAEQYGLVRGNLLDTKGDSYFDDNNYADREYFQHAMEGEAFVSTPVRSNITGELTIIVAAPLWKDGEMGSEVVGVVYFVPDENFLNDIVSSVHVTENTNAYLIDNAGNTIADVDPEKVCNENILTEAQQNSSLQTLANYYNKMIAGESGVGEYTIDGVSKLFGYAPVAESDNWSLGLAVPLSDLMGSVYSSMAITIGLVVLALLIGIGLAIKLAVSIGKPIKMCADRIDLMVDGDLTSPMPQFKSNDETGRLVQSTTVIVNNLQNLIGDIKHLLSEMSNGNFNVRSQNYDYYVGDYAQILESFKQIVYGLSSTMNQIGEASDQVAAGASQVSSGAQALAQGATEQASTIEELSATVNDISDDSQKTAQMALSAKAEADKAGTELTSSNEYIEQLGNAMREIADSSKQIGVIINTIEDIAFQTNILALNAAVEAARAGTAGKGFAVVADEVRNLASKSDQAAKATKELVEKSISAIDNGVQMMNSVTEASSGVMTSAQKAVSSMDSVAEAIQRQTYSISQVTQGIDQISSVVQTNSATAEESAAASEELSGQADMLKSLLRNFQLRDDGQA